MTDALLIAVLGGSAVAAVITGGTQIVLWVLTRRAAQKDKGTDSYAHIRKALMLLMQDRIQYLAKRHITAGTIGAEELEGLMAMHACYHDELGGNGFLDNIMARAQALQIQR